MDQIVNIVDGIELDGDSIVPRPDMEPKDYFLQLKADKKQVDIEKFNLASASIAKEIRKAHEAGQKVLLHRLAFMWEVVQKEITAAVAGFDTYVYREDVVKLVDNIKPAKSILVTELENFSRIIPDENIEIINKAKSLNIFDGFLVVYTDLSGDTNIEKAKETREAFVARNRDPVVFGLFMSKTLSVRHERMYYITDWEDEYCDLTFAKMVDKLSEMNGKTYKPKKISYDANWINEVVSAAKEEIQSKTANSWEAQNKKESLITWFKKKVGLAK